MRGKASSKAGMLSRRVVAGELEMVSLQNSGKVDGCLHQSRLNAASWSRLFHLMHMWQN